MLLFRLFAKTSNVFTINLGVFEFLCGLIHRPCTAVNLFHLSHPPFPLVLLGHLRRSESHVVYVTINKSFFNKESHGAVHTHSAINI